MPADEDAIPITISNGYIGDPNAWCFCESEYPEDGTHGPYPSRDAVIEAVRAYTEQTGCQVYIDCELSWEKRNDKPR